MSLHKPHERVAGSFITWNIGRIILRLQHTGPPGPVWRSNSFNDTDADLKMGLLASKLNSKKASVTFWYPYP